MILLKGTSCKEKIYYMVIVFFSSQLIEIRKATCISSVHHSSLRRAWQTELILFHLCSVAPVSVMNYFSKCPLFARTFYREIIYSDFVLRAAIPKRCLKFDYHMDGNYQGQGELHAKMKDTSGHETELFSVRGKQGAGWRSVSRQLVNSRDYEVCDVTLLSL